jgi:choline transport protein
VRVRVKMSKNESLRVRESALDNVEKPGDSEHIAPKYRGTEADRHDMSILGKKQVLRRQFKFSTMLGFASTVMVAWEFVLFTTPFTLEDGGTAGVFWGLLICPFVMLPVYASLAEVASMCVCIAILGDTWSSALTVLNSQEPNCRRYIPPNAGALGS